MNPIILLLLLPVLSRMVLLLVIRNERRLRFLQQRLTKLTADDSESAPLTLVRKLHHAPTVIFQLPRKFTTMLNAAFEAAGNRGGFLHLMIAGLISAIIVIAFASRLLALSPGLVMLVGLTAAAAGPVVLLRLAQARYRTKFLDTFPDALDLIRRAVT